MRSIPARPARYAATRRPLSEPVQAALRGRGLARLFIHQAQVRGPQVRLQR